MSVRPVLFVGCGGSGGATLQYVMDGLRTELNKAVEAGGGRVDLGPKGLPDAWQFVHVDVPSSPDSGANPSRPPTVPEQGGIYVGMAPSGLTYAQVARSAWESAGAKRPDLMSGWMREPGSGDPDLGVGAGQMRAVGRAATLYRLGTLQSRLTTALGAMTSSHATQQLSQLASVLGGGPMTQAETVFVVSSMSGGSGASMVLDVAHIIARLKPTLADSMSLFLYTSEVFSHLNESARRGVEANGMAAMGELLATALGANQGDSDLFEKLGVSGQPVSRPFKRVFPIGNKHGQNQAIFGDGQHETIYRAVGRGLAGLVASPATLNEFINFDVTNSNPTASQLEWLGEGSKDGNAVQWGSFGFARLSLGRDRYGEYVAQRFAREAVDRLVAGHLHNETQAGEQQLKAVTDDAHFRILRAMGLPASSGAPVRPGDFLLSFLGRGDAASVQRQLASDVQENIGKNLTNDPNLAMALPGERFVKLIRALTAQRKAAVMSAAQERSYATVHAWQRQFVLDLVRLVEDVVSRDGLSAARQVVIKLKDDSAGWVEMLRNDAHALAPSGSTNLPDIPAAILDPIQALTSVSPDHPLRNQLMSGFSVTVTKLAAASAGAMLAEALSDFGQGFADPLINALQLALAQLRAERTRSVSRNTVADLRTVVYAEWPAPHAQVPPRFAGADNEVLLMDVEQFPHQFDAHLGSVARARGERSAGADTMDVILREILTDKWPGNNDDQAVSAVIGLTAQWVPSSLTEDPKDPANPRSRSIAAFALHFTPADILDRARLWTVRENGEYHLYLDQGLREYVAEAAGAPEEFITRRRELLAKFGSALQQALPLVQINPEAFGVVHGSTPEEQFNFSALPFAGMSDNLGGDLQDVLRARSSTSSETVARFSKALNDKKTVAHIDIFGSYAPMTPLAFPSLLRPLAEAWRKSVAMRDTRFFWSDRRSRPLPGCLAMSNAERRATIAGWMIGKTTGRIRGSYAHKPHEPALPIEVFDESKNRWLPFPSPLLSPYVDRSQGDEFAALLESQLLAIAACGFDSTLAPLEPYIAMRRLFGSVVQQEDETLRVDSQGRGYQIDTGRAYLRQWIVDGYEVPGGGPIGPKRAAESSAVKLLGAEDRRTATLNYLTTIRDNRATVYKTEDPLRNPFLRQYSTRPMAATLAVDFVWALDKIIEIVESISLTDSEDIGPGHGPEEVPV